MAGLRFLLRGFMAIIIMHHVGDIVRTFVGTPFADGFLRELGSFAAIALVAWLGWKN